MKYGRPIDCGDGNGIRRMIDVIEVSDPLPDWAEGSPDKWLDVMFANNKVEWVKAGTWFVPVLDDVQPGAFHLGDGFQEPLAFLNPDGTDGSGKQPEDKKQPQPKVMMDKMKVDRLEAEAAVAEDPI